MRNLKSGIFMAVWLITCIFFTALPRAKAEENVLSVALEVGEGNDKVGYYHYTSGTEGPQDFLIDGTTIYLLDSENSRIMVLSSKGWERNIEIDAYASQLELIDGDLYVYSPTLHKVYCYDLEGTLKSSYGTMSGRITAAGAKEKVTEQRSYEYEGCLLRETTVVLSEQYSRVLRYNLETDCYTGESFLVKKDGTGSVVGYSALDLEGWEFVPKNYVRVVGDKIYVMNCYSDSVTIGEAVFTAGEKEAFAEAVAPSQSRFYKRRASVLSGQHFRVTANALGGTRNDPYKFADRINDMVD